MSFEEHLDMVNLLKDDKLAEALVVLDQHIDRTKTTYSNEIEDIAAADSVRGTQ
jgi:DNA-binding GntR family transcriptional regulator